MRDYGKVYTKFWTGRARELSEDGRTLFLYLLTSPHSNGIGCSRLPVAYIRDDLQWDAKQDVGQGVAHGVDTVCDRVLDTLNELVKKGFIDRDPHRDWVRLINWFEHNPVENPSVAKSFIPFIEAVPKNSPLYQPLIESLRQFSGRFPEGYFEGVRQGVAHGVGHPVDTVCHTESSSSSRESCLSKIAASTDSARGKPVDNPPAQKEINLKNYDAAAACCAVTYRRKLTQADEGVLIGWHGRGYDIEKQVLPVLAAKAAAYMEKHGAMPANPLSYFSKAIEEATAKAQKSAENRIK